MDGRMAKEVNLELLASKINRNLQNLSEGQMQWFSQTIKLSDSPLESLLASALASRACLPEAQVEVPPYRVDFAFQKIRLACEVDGWQFHKRRWIEDRRRDRLLLRAGWSVLRFAGTEVWRDSKACAAEIESTYLAMAK